jgi:hypothetical protein
MQHYCLHYSMKGQRISTKPFSLKNRRRKRGRRLNAKFVYYVFVAKVNICLDDMRYMVYAWYMV